MAEGSGDNSPNSSSRRDRDPLELLVEVINSHDETLSRLEDKLDKLLEALLLGESPRMSSSSRGRRGSTEYIFRVVPDWREFKRISSEPEAASFHLDGEFAIYAKKDDHVYKYSEPLFALDPAGQMIANQDPFVQPRNSRIQLNCGLDVGVAKMQTAQPDGRTSFNFEVNLDKKEVLNWIAYQLQVDVNKVRMGRIYI
jgi:hypothetical protein